MDENMMVVIILFLLLGRYNSGWTHYYYQPLPLRSYPMITPLTLIIISLLLLLVLLPTSVSASL